MTKAQGFPRAARLRHRAQFLNVQGKGRRYHLRHFLVFAAFDQRTANARMDRLPQARLGVTVTRKVGNAVVRNRIRRWVREAFRRHKAQFDSHLDMVWVAKRSRVPENYAAVENDLHRLLNQRPGPEEKSA